MLSLNEDDDGDDVDGDDVDGDDVGVDHGTGQLEIIL